MCRYLKIRRNGLNAVTPFLDKLNSVKQDDHALIRSFPGCIKQGLHTDYYSMRSHGKVPSVSPYSVLIALEEGSSIWIGLNEIHLSAGTAIILRGDTIHSGSAYEYDNIRYHIYMDVRGMHVASEGTHVHWV